MEFEAICDENVPNDLKSTQKVASARNLRSNNEIILINFNQQSKTFEKHTRDIFNKLPTNIESVEKLSVFKTKVKNYFLDQALAGNFEDLIYVKELYFDKINKKRKQKCNKIFLDEKPCKYGSAINFDIYY